MSEHRNEGLQLGRLGQSNATTPGGWDEASAAFERGEYAVAARLLRPLAQQGDARAQFGLGFLYDTGQGVPQDYHEALNLRPPRPEQVSSFRIGTTLPIVDKTPKIVARFK
jgi:TPR repeat protein